MADRKQDGGQVPPVACPNCTSTLGPFNHSPQRGIEQIVCSTCGMHGPYNSVTKTATESWNELAGKLTQ